MSDTPSNQPPNQAPSGAPQQPVQSTFTPQTPRYEPPPPGYRPPSPRPPGRPASFWFALILGFLFLGTAAIAFLLLLAFATVQMPHSSSSAAAHYPEETLKTGGASRVAVVDINGIIGDIDGMVDRTVKMLRQAGDDATVKAVVLSVDSPGGGVTASDVICNEVKKLKEKKPVVTHMGDLCASGGVYVSAPSNKIVASPTSITGSIGVIIGHYNMQDLFEQKLGIKAEPFTSGKHKDILSMSRPVSPEEKKIIQETVDEMYQRFVGVVADGRRGHGPVPADPDAAKAYIKNLADGRIYTGEQALKNGLVDATGYFDDAVAEAAKLGGATNPTVIRYRRLPTLMDILAGGQYQGQNGSASLQQELSRALTPRIEYRLNWGRD